MRTRALEGEWDAAQLTIPSERARTSAASEKHRACIATGLPADNANAEKGQLRADAQAVRPYRTRSTIAIA